MGTPLRRRRFSGVARLEKSGPLVVTKPRWPCCISVCKSVMLTPPKKRLIWRCVASFRLRWFQSLKISSTKVPDCDGEMWKEEGEWMRVAVRGREDIPAKNQRTPMAGYVVADFFPGIGVEAQDLVNQLLEIAIIPRRTTREPGAAKHVIQLIERDRAREHLGHIQRRPNGVAKDLRARDSFHPAGWNRAVE